MRFESEAIHVIGSMRAISGSHVNGFEDNANVLLSLPGAGRKSFSGTVQEPRMPYAIFSGHDLVNEVAPVLRPPRRRPRSERIFTRPGEAEGPVPADASELNPVRRRRASAAGRDDVAMVGTALTVDRVDHLADRPVPSLPSEQR
jgi:hypothetical protein